MKNAFNHLPPAILLSSLFWMHLIFESFRQYSCDPSSISCSCTGLFTVGTHTHMHIIYIIYYVVVPNNARVVNDRGYIHVSIMQVAGRRGQDPPIFFSQDRMDGEARPRNIVHGMSFTLLAAPTTNLDILRLASILDLRLQCEN